jgi:RNA polymerase sigma-70 factor, ECF subfamily
MKREMPSFEGRSVSAGTSSTGGLQFARCHFMITSARSSITTILQQYRDGDSHALNRLFEQCHLDLKRIARNLLRNERPNHTLQPTALVNEAVLRLLDDQLSSLTDHVEFYSAVAREMRRALTDYARRRLTDKRGHGDVPLPLDAIAPPWFVHDIESLVALDQALERLAVASPRCATVVELRYVLGLSTAEIATLLRTTTRTVERDWAWARTELYADLKGESR